MELKLYKKAYDNKVVKELNFDILDINELSDKRIIVILNFTIIILKKDNKEYMTLEEYEIKDKWKISLKGYSKANQYYSSDELPNKRLLISSFLIGRKFVRGNAFHRCISKEFSNSKIIVIDTNNFDEIKSTKIFNEEANYIILANYIIIQADYEIWLYDINSLELIQNMVFYIHLIINIYFLILKI